MSQQTDSVPATNGVSISAPEHCALRVVIVAMVGFGAYGVMTGASNTVPYLVTVSVIAAVIWLFRGATVPQPLAMALAGVAVLHLAGGLVRIGDDVLYNASFGSPAFRYDHFAHAYGSFVGTLALWAVLVPHAVDLTRRRVPTAVWVLAGLGLGAINETVEFLTTMANHGGHVGGYTNTGWDLVSNVVGAVAAGVVVSRMRRNRGRFDELRPA